MTTEHLVLLGALTFAGVLITAGIAMQGHLLKRITDLETDHRELWRLRECDAVTKRNAGDHIDTLEAHIWAGLGPPPPPRPVGV